MISDREGLDKDVSNSSAAMWTSVAGASIGAAAGTGLMGTAVGAITPSLLGFIRSVVDRARDTQDRRAAQAVEIAAEIVGGLDVMNQWTATDEVRFTLLAEVIEAAARTPLKVKIQALAEVLAEGLQVDGNAHEARIVAAALANIEAPHIDVLRFLRDNPRPPEERIVPDQATLSPLGWDTDQLRAALPDVALLLDGLIAVLAGHGLIKNQGGRTWGTVAGSNQFAVTDLGRRCLFLLQFGADDAGARSG